MKKSTIALSVILALPMLESDADAMQSTRKSAGVVKNNNSSNNHNVQPTKDVPDLPKDDDPFAELKHNLGKVAEQYKELSEKLAISKSVILDHMNEINNLKNEINNLKSEISALEKMGQEKDAVINELNNKINELEKIIQDKDAQINNLKNEINELEKMGQEKDAVINELNNKTNELEKIIQDKDAQIKKLQENIKNKNQMIKQIQQNHDDAKENHSKQMNEIARQIEGLQNSIISASPEGSKPKEKISDDSQ